MNKTFQMKKNFVITALVSLFLIAFIYFLSNLLHVDESEFDEINLKQTENDLYTIVRVIDGDTVVIKINAQDEIIRLIGINTPEIVDPRRPVECFGREASDKAKETLSGKNVRMQEDDMVDDRDKYGRLLRYIFLEDGTNFGKTMIEEGYAYEYTFENELYKYQEDFKLAETEAKISKKGLWADGVCKD